VALSVGRLFNLSSRVYPGLAARLRGIAPCGVRTFLPRLTPKAIPRPSKIIFILMRNLPKRKLSRKPLICHGQIHIARVIKDASAINTGDDLLLRAA
jgi:hypothetical protein